jgi:hypothetical protein
VQHSVQKQQWERAKRHAAPALAVGRSSSSLLPLVLIGIAETGVGW